MFNKLDHQSKKEVYKTCRQSWPSVMLNVSKEESRNATSDHFFPCLSEIIDGPNFRGFKRFRRHDGETKVVGRRKFGMRIERLDEGEGALASQGG